AGVFTAATTLLATGHNVWFAGVLLFLVGAGFTAWSANSNASVQLAAPDRLRGRLIGIYFYAFNGTGPFAGLFAGWLCSVGGTDLACVVAGAAGMAGTALAARKLQVRPPFRRAALLAQDSPSRGIFDSGPGGRPQPARPPLH